MKCFKDYAEFYDEFMPSIEIREYLKCSDDTEWHLCDLIFFSPTTIEKKRDAFQRLLKRAKDEKDEDLQLECAKFMRNIDDAISESKGDAVFTIEVCEYNADDKDSSLDFETVCTTYDAAVSSAKEYHEVGEYTDDYPISYEITKWSPVGNGKLEPTCVYIIVRGELWYTFLEHNYYEDYSDCVDTYEMMNLNLPVPFLPGDVLEINGYPYGPIRHIMITDVGDNIDCCSLQALSVNHEGKWNIGAVKHCHVGYNNLFPMLSPLFSASKYDGDFSGDESLFPRIIEYVNQDRSRAEKICDAMICTDGFTDEEMIQLMESDLK